VTDEDMQAVGSRREFFKKMVALGVAIPVISSFSLEGVAAAEDDDYRYRYGNGGDWGFRYGNGGEYDHHHHRYGNGSSWLC